MKRRFDSKLCSRSLLLGLLQPFDRFLLYPVRFATIGVLIVHAEMSRETSFCTNGPMDTIPVKSWATVAQIRQSQSVTLFRHSSQTALQANSWTVYASPPRTKPLSNHTGVPLGCFGGRNS